jgi:hypothetical protein
MAYDSQVFHGLLALYAFVKVISFSLFMSESIKK